MTNRNQQLSRPNTPRLAKQLALVPLLVVFLGVSALAQNVDFAAKLRLAQSFEQVGDWEKAAAIYESLLESNPDGFVVLDGLRRSYTELKEYDKAIGLVRRQLQTNPKDENLQTILGGVYDLANKPEVADSVWHVVIRRDPQNANLFD